MKKTIDKKRISKILKIKKDFLFLDKITSINKKKIEAIYYLKENSWFMKSHFLNNPVMPGSLQIEAMLQASASLIYISENNFDIVYITKVQSNFLNKINTKSLLKIYSTIKHNKNGVLYLNSQIIIKKKKICEAKFVYVNPNKFKI